PFANINKSWEDGWNATLIYRRTIRRPGLDQMNPSIDYSDPYNIRYGNPQLLPSLSHEFSLTAGRGNSKYYFNGSLGLNEVQNIFTQITTLQPNGTTTTTYDNISNRTEYSAGSWSGYTFSRALKINIGLNYIYSQYGSYDKTVNKYQDNGSFYSNFNVNYIPAKLWNLSLSCLYNRNGSPQGVSTATVNTNLGIQRKFFQKKFIVTLNVSDPFIQQSNTSQLHGPNFDVQSYSTTQTRNYRLTLSYDWSHTIDRGRKQVLKAAHYPI
ncbi:MAG TPA: outer membrane beta-barrel protein, partial [Puia sp.]